MKVEVCFDQDNDIKEVKVLMLKGEKGDPGAKGEQGEKGETGVSVSGAELSENGDLVLTFSDGSSHNAGAMGIKIFTVESDPTASIPPIEVGTWDSETEDALNAAIGKVIQIVPSRIETIYQDEEQKQYTIPAKVWMFTGWGAKIPTANPTYIWENINQNNLLDQFDLDSEKDIQTIVRLGFAREFLSIGDQIICQKGEKTLIWDITGIDKDTPSDERFEHSVTLQLHDCLDFLCSYSEPQAFYVLEERTEPTSFRFTIEESQFYPEDNGKIFTFSVDVAMEAGTQFVFSGQFNRPIVESKVNVFSGPESRAIIKAVDIEEISEEEIQEGVIDIGTIQADTENGNVNSYQRAREGSSDYFTSNIRKYLNSSAPAGEWWKPDEGEIFARKPSLADLKDGFLYDIDPDFLAILGDVKKRTNRTTGNNAYTTEETSEKIFLISGPETGSQTGQEQGDPYPYYSDVGSDQSVRIKLYNGSPKEWWTRSPNISNITSVCGVRCGLPTGGVGVGYASAYYGVVPVCCIV